jgi:Circularly permutated YpsA SLOG family
LDRRRIAARREAIQHESMARVLKVVSGGQTGVDRAALDAAEAAGLPCGGWCPRGRLAEDGPIDPAYPLVETPSTDYPQRTEWNVRDSDATLVIARGRPTGGTALTISLARRYGKPLLVVDLAGDPTPEEAWRWLEAHGIVTLNVAGPRESQRPGIGRKTHAFLERLFSRARRAEPGPT